MTAVLARICCCYWPRKCDFAGPGKVFSAFMDICRLLLDLNNFVKDFDWLYKSESLEDGY